MKSLIQIVLVALIMGGVSAAGSYYWKQWFAPAVPAIAQTETEAAPNADGDAGEQPQGAHSAHSDSGDHTAAATETASSEPAHTAPADRAIEEYATEPRYVPPVAARPPYVAEGDEAGQLITALRTRVKAIDDAEVRLAERQSALTLIFDDLRSEQLSATRMRQQVLNELGESGRLMDESLQSRRTDDAALRAARDEQDRLKKELDSLRQSAAEQDRQRKQLELQHQSAPKGNDTVVAPDTSGSLEENANLKKLAAVYDAMPPENTAKVLQQLVKNNKTAATVSLLNAMKERQTSKVLALISEADPELAADLTERLKRLKKEPAPAAVQ